jgi:TM2 domain-containing membrane protein YozV
MVAPALYAEIGTATNAATNIAADVGTNAGTNFLLEPLRIQTPSLADLLPQRPVIDPRVQVMNLMQERKDPYVAAVFSLFYSGIGQFYNGSFTKGSLFFLGETLYYAFNWGLYLKFQNTYLHDTVSFDSLNNLDKTLLVGSFIGFIAFKAFCIYDAYSIASYINSTIDRKIDEVMVSYEDGSLKVLCGVRF